MKTLLFKWNCETFYLGLQNGGGNLKTAIFIPSQGVNGISGLRKWGKAAVARPSFDIAFTLLRHTHMTYCSVVIKVGSRVWKGGGRASVSVDSWAWNTEAGIWSV